MDRKPILGKLPVEFLHDPITGDLGQDTGGGNTQTETISSHERRLFHRETPGRQPIHKGMSWRMSDFLQSIQRPPHGQMGGTQDVQMTNFLA